MAEVPLESRQLQRVTLALRLVYVPQMTSVGRLDHATCVGEIAIDDLRPATVP
jgi:hypothetical protein